MRLTDYATSQFSNTSVWGPYRSAWMVVNTQVKACSRKTHSLSRACKIYGHKAFQITHLYATVINSGRTALLNIAHTVGCTVELASALTAARILADATVTPTVSEMTYNVSTWDIKPHSTNQPNPDLNPDVSPSLNRCH